MHTGISQKTPLPYAICYCVSTGSSYYDNVRPLAYPDSDAVLVCFDISRPETLDSVIKKVSVFSFHFISSSGSAFNICSDTRELTGKNSLSPDQHLVPAQQQQLHFHGSTIEQISTEARASCSFISSKTSMDT